LVGRAQELAGTAHAFHWPLEFPDIMAAGGFDAVLGNPPWERIKLQEQEFFAAREPEIAEAPNAAARGRLIANLKDAAPGTRERALYDEFEAAKRTAEASSVFARVDTDSGGRFPLTGRGDVNTYALFAELFSTAMARDGRAGMIVPTGIATDANTSAFFATLTEHRRILSLHSFYEVRAWFPSTDDRNPFALLCLGHSNTDPIIVFDAHSLADIQNEQKLFKCSSHDLRLLNPNTRTIPTFRSEADALLTKRIYQRFPILIKDGSRDGNRWSIKLGTMFHMSGDSSLFRTAEQLAQAGAIPSGYSWRASPSQADRNIDPGTWLPLFEGKAISHFDHRYGTYAGFNSRPAYSASLPEPTLTDRQNARFDITPWYWVHESHVAEYLRHIGWDRAWMFGWRDVTKSSNERTVIPSCLPRVGAGHTLPLLFVDHTLPIAAIIAGLSSLVFDYFARQKMNGPHLTFTYLKQFPFPSPETFAASDIAFIVPRVLELTYTSHSMAPFARDLGYEGAPYPWDEDRRALLRAELDAWYARVYGLTRDELRYILDPADVKGPDYPSETFRVLKGNEIKRFREYRTARLVLTAWDRLACGELGAP
jgi:hypothetical protein